MTGALIDVLLAMLARPSFKAVAEIRIYAITATQGAGLMTRAAATLIHVITTQVPTKPSRAVALKVIVKIDARSCVLTWVGVASVGLF